MASSNTVNLTSSLIETVSYVAGSIVITPGESHKDSASITQDGPKWIITIEADRSGSNGVADKFNTQVGGPYHEYAPDGGGTGKQPDKLNFYFAVRVTFNIRGNRIQETLYLGQGHYGTTNNWWIGANHVVNAGKPEFLAISDNNIQQIFTMSGNTNSFVFTTVG